MEMAFCSNCGRKLKDDEKFCWGCGEANLEYKKAKHSAHANNYDAELTMSVTLSGDINSSTQVYVYVPHMHKTIQIAIPNNITAEQTLRLKGLGLVSPDGEKGDLYLHLDHIEYKQVDDTSSDDKNDTKRRSVYDGEIHKCPNCGEAIAAYDTICKTCGYEIRGRKTASVVHELTVKLEQTDDAQKKDEIIRTFYIPNTREDIYEFFILALSQVKIGGMNTNAWMVKLEQAYQKAELSFFGTEEFERLKLMYEKAKRLNKKNSTLSFLQGMGKYFKSGYAWALLFFGISVFCRLICTIFGAFGTLGFFVFFYELADFLQPLALIIALATLISRTKKAKEDGRN